MAYITIISTLLPNMYSYTFKPLPLINFHTMPCAADKSTVQFPKKTALFVLSLRSSFMELAYEGLLVYYADDVSRVEI